MRTATNPSVGRARVAPGLVLIGIASEIVAVFLVYGAYMSQPRVQVVVVWSSLSFAAFATGLLVLVGGRHGRALGLPQFKLGSWALLWCVFAFGLASTSWRNPQIGSAARVDVGFVPMALAATAAGLATWVLGYAIGPGQSLVRAGRRGMGRLSRSREPVVRSLATPWLLYAVGITGRLATVATRGQLGYVGDASRAVDSVTGYSQALSVLGLFAQFAVAAAAIQVYYQCQVRARLTLVLLVTMEIVFSGISGEKQVFIATILAVLIPLGAMRQRLPVLPVLITIAMFMFLIIPFNQEYRAEVRSSNSTLAVAEAVAEAPRVLRYALSSESLERAVPDSFDYMTKRIRNIDSLAIIQQRSPDSVPFLSPLELVTAPILGIVPRAVWSEKPVLAKGYQFAQVYYLLPATTYTSSAVTPTGDLYRHGGFATLLIGMLIFGMGVKLADSVLDVRRNPHSCLFVLLLFPPFVKYEADYVTLVASMPTTILAAVVAVFLTFKVRKAPE